MTKWLVITVMACALTFCGNPAYAKSCSSGKPFYIMLPQADGVAEAECVKQIGGVYNCQED